MSGGGGGGGGPRAGGGGRLRLRGAVRRPCAGADAGGVPGGLHQGQPRHLRPDLQRRDPWLPAQHPARRARHGDDLHLVRRHLLVAGAGLARRLNRPRLRRVPLVGGLRCGRHLRGDLSLIHI